MWLNRLDVVLGVVAIGLSCFLWVGYWRERRWAWQAPPSVRTMASEALQTETFRISKQGVLLLLVLLAQFGGLLLENGQIPELLRVRDWAAIGRTALEMLFIVTSLNAWRLRRKARAQFRTEQAERARHQGRHGDVRP